MRRQRRKLHIYNFFYSIKNLTYIFSLPLILVFALGKISIFSSILYLVYFYVLAILIFSITLCVKFLIYMNTTIYSRDNYVKINSGIINKKTMFINIQNTYSLIFKKSIIAKILKIYNAFFVFPINNFDLKNGIFLTKAQTNNLKNKFLGKPENIIFPKINFCDLVILSFSYNSAFSFVILVFSVLKKIQKIMETKKSIKIFVWLSKFPLVYIIIPVILGVLCVRVIKFWGLHSEKFENKINIKSGLCISSEHIIPCDKIYAVSYKINPINIMFQKKIMYIHSAKNKINNGNSVIAVTPLRECADNKLPFLGKEILKIRPAKKSFFSYVYFPILSVISAFLGYMFLFGSIAKLAIFLLTLITFIWLYIRIYSFVNAKLSLTSNSIIVSGYRGFSFFEAIIPKKHIKHLKISQSPLQILSKKCNVCIYSSPSIKENFKIKHLNVNNVENLVETLENSHINY